MRMNRSRTIILAIAVVAGSIAAYLASGSDTNRPVPPPAVAQIPTVEVLVARSDIALGQTITPDLMQWQTWTETSASNNFITRKDRPNAVTDLAGSIRSEE